MPPAEEPDPLREYKHAPVYLLFYLSFLVVLLLVLVGEGKRPVITC